MNASKLWKITLTVWFIGAVSLLIISKAFGETFPPPTTYVEPAKPKAQAGDSATAIATIAEMRMAVWYFDQYGVLLKFVNVQSVNYAKLYEAYSKVFDDDIKQAKRADRNATIATWGVGVGITAVVIEALRISFTGKF